MADEPGLSRHDQIVDGGGFGSWIGPILAGAALVGVRLLVARGQTEGRPVNPPPSARRRRYLDEIRDRVGVSDPTWWPPESPEDRGLKSDDRRRPDWHAGDRSPDDPIGKRFQLAHDARIVVPARLALATLALLRREVWDRYTLAAGTELQLVERSDPDADADGVDYVYWITYLSDWETRTYRVETGPWTGLRLTFSDARDALRFPWSSRMAHDAIRPIDRSLAERSAPLALGAAS